MAGGHIKPSGAVKHMTISSTKVLLVLVLLLHVTEGMSGCCAKRPRACGLYGLLCRPEADNDTEAKPVRINSDAAMGILTLGKRKTTESRYQERLQHFLHGARNQAAGILTMGRRNEDGGAHPLSRTSHIGTIHAPVKLDLERPMEYLMQQSADKDNPARL